jgi:hypothetical protein
MQALEFWQVVTMDRANRLSELTALLDTHQIRYCVIGGAAVNAYVDPVVTLDLDLVIATEQLDETENLLAQRFVVKRFPPSLNISTPDSELRVQIQTDPRYAEFVARSARRRVLGLELPVAQPRDVLLGKIWAAQDPTRRTSKYFKDLADLSRLLEAFPELRTVVPNELLKALNAVTELELQDRAQRRVP